MQKDYCSRRFSKLIWIAVLCSRVLQLRGWRLRAPDCCHEHDRRIFQHGRNFHRDFDSADFDNHDRGELDDYSRDLHYHRCDHIVDGTIKLRLPPSFTSLYFSSKARDLLIDLS